MGRYDAIKLQKTNKSKLWFKDVLFIENSLNKIRDKNREIYIKYRNQIKTMLFDLGECVDDLCGYDRKIEHRSIIENKIGVLRIATEELNKEIYGSI